MSTWKVRAAVVAVAFVLSPACGGDGAENGDVGGEADASPGDGSDVLGDAEDGGGDADVPAEAEDDAAGAEGEDVAGDGCLPAEETCNGLDDDCDGLTDEAGVTGCESGRQCLGGRCRFGGLPDWGIIFHDGEVDPRGVAVDPEGRITIVGCYGAAVDFGGGTRANLGTPAGFVLALDNSMSYRWDQTFGLGPSSAGPCAEAVAVDPLDSRVVVVGGFAGTTTFGAETRTASGSLDGFVVTYAFDGAEFWDETFGAAGHFARATAVAIDGVSIFLAGSGDGPLTIHGHSLTLGSGGDVFVARVPAEGFSAGGWAVGISSTGADNARGIAFNVDSVVVGGDVGGDVDFGGGPRRFGGLTDGYYAVLNVTDGSWDSDQLFGGAGYSAAYAVAMTTAGGFVVAGGFSGDADFGGGARASVGDDWDGFAATLRRTGAWVADETFHGTIPSGTHIDIMTAVAADGEGGYAVAGTIGGQPAVRRYDSSGTLLWDWRMTSAGTGTPASVSGVAFAPDGVVVLVGKVVGGLSFPGGSVGGDGAFLMRIRD